MMYKFLLMIYVGFLLLSTNSLFKKYDPSTIKKGIEKSSLGDYTASYFLVSLFMSIPMMILYVKTYYLSPSLEWLSVFQFALTCVGIVRSILIPTMVNDGTYKSNKLWHAFMVGLDFYYLYLILTVIN